MKKTVTIILMVLSATMVGAQDLTHYKRVIKELSSARYQGRGYAQVQGERHDSCYVFTAHYDHLGNLGKKVFYAFQYYHTIFDTYKTVRFDSYEPVFRLVRDFVEQY